MNKYLSILSTSALFLCVSGSVFSQTAAPGLNLNRGDEYKKVSSMTSTVVMTRGDKKINMSTMSTITKSYQVQEADNNGYQFLIKTTHVADTIDAFGQKAQYSSDRVADTTSYVENGLSNLVKLPSKVSVDKSGKITQVDEITKGFYDANLLSLSGVYSKLPVKGNVFGLAPSFTLPAGAAKGKSWTENTKKTGVESKTRFTVDDISDKATTVSFTSEVKETGANTNLNGVFIVDNATGVVIQRIVKSSTISNETMNDMIYQASRNNTLIEVCAKVN